MCVLRRTESNTSKGCRECHSCMNVIRKFKQMRYVSLVFWPVAHQGGKGRPSDDVLQALKDRRQLLKDVLDQVTPEAKQMLERVLVLRKKARKQRRIADGGSKPPSAGGS